MFGVSLSLMLCEVVILTHTQTAVWCNCHLTGNVQLQKNVHGWERAEERQRGDCELRRAEDFLDFLGVLLINEKHISTF